MSEPPTAVSAAGALAGALFAPRPRRLVVLLMGLVALGLRAATNAARPRRASPTSG